MFQRISPLLIEAGFQHSDSADFCTSPQALLDRCSLHTLSCTKLASKATYGVYDHRSGFHETSVSQNDCRDRLTALQVFANAFDAVESNALADIGSVRNDKRALPCRKSEISTSLEHPAESVWRIWRRVATGRTAIEHNHVCPVSRVCSQPRL